jgi:monoamine oxidase
MTKVLILGAGISGLCAAYELNKKGIETTILEARDRIGGRIHTIREPFADGQYAEAGAMVVPDSHQLTKHYIRQFNLQLLESGPVYPALYLRNGHRTIGADSPQELQKRFLGPWVDRVLTSLSSPEWPGELRSLDHLTLEEFLTRQGVSQELIAQLRMEYIDEWGDGIGSYSALSGLYDLARGRSGSLFRIQNGSESLTQAFASHIPRIRLNCSVKRIAQTPVEVQITFSENHTLQSERADLLICTIPFSVLDRVEMDMPVEKRNAISELGYTSVCRIYAQVSERFWEAENLTGFGYTDEDFFSVFHSTATQRGPKGILEAYVSGPLSRKLSALSSSDRLREALTRMEKIHPQIRSFLIQATSICWDNDPCAGGAYSWFKPGQMTGLLAAIQSSVGQIHFAGDHTSMLPGWMQGALESSMRVVDEIVARTSRPPCAG